jgi:iron complex outermembrane receptor protein
MSSNSKSHALATTSAAALALAAVFSAQAAHAQQQQVPASGQTDVSTTTGSTGAAAQVLAVADSAVLQQAPAAGPASAAKGGQNVQDIIVTGSRVVRNGFKAPTPTTVITAQDMQAAAFPNVASLLNQLPQVWGSQTPTSNGVQVSSGTGGQNIINLRNLGPMRTLVLLDGQRVTPTSMPGQRNTPGTNTTDINSLPMQLIQRVDTVTGGASAAYGSDAVGGVVNFILNKTYTGFKINVEGGDSGHNDDAEWSGDITYGANLFGGRGHLLLSAGGEHSDGIPYLDNSVRSWYHGIRQMPNPAFISPSATPNVPALLTYSNVNLSTVAPGGLIDSGPLKGTQFGPGGVLQQFVYGTRVGSPFNPVAQMVGGQTNDINSGLALAPTESRANFFGRTSYDFSDSITGYAQVLFGWSKAGGNASNFFAAPVNVSVNNPFLPATAAALLKAAGQTSFNMGVFTPGIGSLYQYNNRAMGQATLGLDGKLPGNWTWHAFYKYGQTNNTAELRNNILTANFAAAAQVITGPSGAPVCASYLTNPSCVPLNIFGQGVASQAALGYVQGTSRIETRLEQQVGEASINGEPFNTWAGPVSVVGGVGWRLESISTPNVDPNSKALAWFSGNYAPTSGSYNVKEFFAETVVPLAKDTMWAKSLDLNAAVRVTNYSTSGTVVTWKVGGTWQVNNDITFRGIRSHDIRAPNLGELYASGATNNQPNITDPRYNNGPILPFFATTSGNPKLQPEVADQWGVGGIYQPSWFSGFTASIDYYNLTIHGGISTLDPQTEISDCLTGAVPAYCQFVKLGPTTVGGVPVSSSVVGFNATPVNLQTFHQEGYDIEVGYRKNLAGWSSGWDSSVSLRSLANYTPTSTLNAGLGYSHQGAGENAGASSTSIPHWRVNTEITYTQGPFTLSGNWRFISAGVINNSIFDGGTSVPLSTDQNHVPSVSYFDLGLTYRFQTTGHNWQIYGRVTNLLDKAPPLAANTSAYTQQFASNYDAIGRYFRAGLRFEF